MSVSELQNAIIKKLLTIEDVETLSFFKEMLLKKAGDKVHKLSDFEKRIVSESKADYDAGRLLDHDEVFKRNEKWLEQ